MDMLENKKSSYKPRASTGNPRKLRVIDLIKTVAKIAHFSTEKQIFGEK